MSATYEQFAASAFGPVLAELAVEETVGVLTPALKERAIQGWNLTGSAMREVFAECERILASTGLAANEGEERGSWTE